MHQIWKSFRALYFASLMMLIGSGLLSTYLALRLAADNVDGLWVGALMAANYFGLVLGGKIGHRFRMPHHAAARGDMGGLPVVTALPCGSRALCYRFGMRSHGANHPLVMI